jgi:hypothetical protein
VNTFGHFIKRNEIYPPRCVVGGRVPCRNSPAQFLVGYGYHKTVHSKDGNRILTVNVTRVACEEHARAFAEKHGLKFPEVAA